MKRIIVFLIALIFVFGGNTVYAVSDSAAASVVIDAASGEIIYSKNSDKKLPMASTTKIMTALLLCEYGNLDREIKVTKQMVTVEGSSMGLLPEDTVTLRGLLYGMMLPSGNDAANATAYVVGGSIDGFVNKMNLKAKELGLLNTHFVTPSGLDGEGHHTTAYELARLAAYALTNEELLAAASSKKAVLYYGNPPYKRTLTNHNKLLNSYEGLIGVKTGFTKKAGRCLVTAAERDGKRIVAVTLNDPNDWLDHKTLLDYGFSQLVTNNIKPQNAEITMQVVGGEKDSITVKVPEITVNTVGEKSLTTKLYKQPFLYAPVEAGQTVAKLCIYCEGELLKTVDVKANCSVNMIEIKKTEEFKSIFMRIFSAL